MNDNMSPASLAIIEAILNELHFEYEFNDNRSRLSIHIIRCKENNEYNVYFNIPKNVNFVFQLLFENGFGDRKLRDDFALHLRSLYDDSYICREGDFGGEYLTIYLPNEEHIPINPSTKERIKKIIKEEVEKVCKALKSFETA